MEVKVNKNGEHYYNDGFTVYRLPWLDNAAKRSKVLKTGKNDNSRKL